MQSAVCLSATNLFDLPDRNLYAVINQEAKRVCGRVFERITSRKMSKLNIGMIGAGR